MIKNYHLLMSQAAIADIHIVLQIFKSKHPEENVSVYCDNLLNQIASLAADPHSYPSADLLTLSIKGFHCMDLGDFTAYFTVVDNAVQIHRIV